ncbi:MULTISPECIES: YfgM family protein [Hydrogenophaga]|uniref:Ancillary SecYEG translocon subunit/Cell division coordinator CpoB TPR domain-containing protein n=1 Tax=Hydrogenophaga electricum TaxID=1230953 RepID=A0ABQ6C8D0_9BURK|nr:MULTISPECIES: tetratricopeptide repeat protein [Hydrogenophaga]GLS14457.1 hypothetical protein GCM10007935_18880 [Hydrogenophaga electricum]
MAKHLDLEEQEQLDQIKHFWNQYGNAITWVLIVVFGGVAAWNGWNYWQRSQGAKAAAMYDEVERAVLASDAARLEQVLGDLQKGYGRSTYAAQGALLAAQSLESAGKADAARAALTWVATDAGDASLKAVARLRLAALDLEAKAYDQALKTLSESMPKAFEPLAADRRGDVLLAQQKLDEAKAQYQAAWRGLSDRTEYRQLVEVKLAALGVDASAVAASGVAQ